ncbi:hypothetical protein HYH02_011669 [Chlamydomonas schloesseri]|uniref:Rieske domain-containing protein n=1 Tax=Chlamydomonas schloesseri TaxID=2026947 RepID=A0A835W1T8_9CHLO|nr:hypothetical protein HYH02_011669 [Chlamydomonas schloesseri]|eukprot:KAG2436165.1 hypothetical protein HYH02_011669 [Chlamydomonas schloesseri]
MTSSHSRLPLASSSRAAARVIWHQSPLAAWPLASCPGRSGLRWRGASVASGSTAQDPAEPTQPPAPRNSNSSNSSSSNAAAAAPQITSPEAVTPASAADAAAVTLPDCVFAREEEDDGDEFAGPLPPGVRMLDQGDGAVTASHAATEAAAPRPRLANGSARGCCGGSSGCGAAAAAAPPLPRRVPFVVAAASVVTETRLGVSDTAANGDAAAPQEAAAEQPQAAAGDKFDWFRQWYPVAPLDTLDPTRPHPFTLLGQELVLWRDGGGTWRAFRDACPHRLAPLSEGRIEADGTLLCAYHGWRFDGSGGCTTIPNFTDEAAHAKATGSRRACATAYPTRHLGGLLWVWGSGGPGAEAEAAAKQPMLPPEIQEDGSGAPGVDAPGWSFRDLPYGHVYFVENVVDPAHVPVSHHKVAGDRYRDLKKAFRMELSRPVTRDGGFEVTIPNPWRSDVQTSSTAFYPPSHVRIQQNHHNGSTTILALYSTPTVPGWTRHVGMQLRKEAPGGGPQGSGIAFFGLPLPRWLLHTAGSLFLHQDMVFLHHQERTVARDQAERLQQQQQQQQQQPGAATAAAAAAGDGRQQQQAAATTTTTTTAAPLPPPKYYMPTSVDTGVTALRTWLATYSNGDVTWAPGTPPLGPRERDPAKLFDTWHTHTSKCTVCLKALARMRAVRAAAIAAAFAATLAATVTAAARAAAAAAASAAAAGAGAGSAAAVGGSGGVWGAVVAAAQAFACGEVGVLALVAALAAAVAAVTVKLEALMHRYDYNHADNV